MPEVFGSERRVCEAVLTSMRLYEPGDLAAERAKVERYYGQRSYREVAHRVEVRLRMVEGWKARDPYFWQYLGNPVAATDSGAAWYLGEGADQRNEALLSLEAPNFTLPDFSVKLHSLTDFRRKRVLLITWASW